MDQNIFENGFVWCIWLLYIIFKVWNGRKGQKWDAGDSLEAILTWLLVQGAFLNCDLNLGGNGEHT